MDSIPHTEEWRWVVFFYMVGNIFCSTNYLKNSVNKPTCFKNIGHPSCIDLILSNLDASKNTSVIDTGVSDLHRLKVTIMKMNFRKQAPKMFNH